MIQARTDDGNFSGGTTPAELLKFSLVRVVAAVGVYYCSKGSEINKLQRRKVYFGSWFVDLHLWSLGPLASEPVVKPTDGVAEVNWSPGHQDTTKFMA